MPIYTNATDVLPHYLLTLVQHHWRGLLYVPPLKEDLPVDPYRDALLAIRSGCPAKNVALIYGIPTWRVYRLARQLGSLNPYADQAHRQGGRPRRCVAEK